MLLALSWEVLQLFVMSCALSASTAVDLHGLVSQAVPAFLMVSCVVDSKLLCIMYFLHPLLAL